MAVTVKMEAGEVITIRQNFWYAGNGIVCMVDPGTDMSDHGWTNLGPVDAVMALPADFKRPPEPPVKEGVNNDTF